MEPGMSRVDGGEARGLSSASRGRGGFTLIEVLIVLAIVLLLAGLVGVTVFNRRDKADVDVTKINLNTLRSALDSFRMDFRRYPTEEEGLAVLWDKSVLDAEADSSMWMGYVREAMTADQWGTAYGYRVVEAPAAIDSADEAGAVAEPAFELWSNGPDKQEGTADDIRVGAAGADGGSMGSGGSDLIPPAAGEP